MESSAKVFQCGMELTLDIIGGKWKPILIFHIGNAHNIRYGALKRIVPTISERVLSRELKALEKAKIVIRKEFKEKVLRVEYSLTPIGYEVLPVLHALTKWGDTYNQMHAYARIICQIQDT